MVNGTHPYFWKSVKIAVSLFFLVIIFQFSIPKVKHIFQLHRQGTSLAKTIQTAENMETVLTQQGKRKKEMLESLEKLKKSSSSIVDFSQMIIDLEAQAKKQNLTIISINPAKKIKQNNFTEFPLLMELEGSFKQIGILISYWESSQNVIVNKIDMKKNTAESQTINASIELVLVFFQEDGYENKE
jgi:Tfp pilus assembly protein PilO